MPRLFVRGVSEIPEKEVEQLFEKYGRVVNIQTGQAGFSFIEMETDKDCDAAISGLDGIEIEGHKLTVEKARGKEHGHGGRVSKESKSGEFLCYNCNKPGHLARDCKEKPRNPLYVDTRGTKITDVSRHSQERFHPYARGSSDRGSKYDDGQSRERRFERSPPREPRDSRDIRDYRDTRDPREIRDPRYPAYDSRPAERRYSPPPSDRRPLPPDYYPPRGAVPAVPMRDYPPVQRGRSPERFRGALPERRIPDPRMDYARPARGGSEYYMDRRIPAQTESYRRSPEPAYVPRPRSRSPPDHYREYRGAPPPSDVYSRGRSPERMARPIPQRGPEVRRGRSPERYPEAVETRRYSRSPPPVQNEYRGYQGNERFRNERRDDNNNDYGRGRRDRRTPERRSDGSESFGGSGVKGRPLTPESKPEDGRPQTP